MKKIEKIYLIAELLFEHLGDKHSFLHCMAVANAFIALARTPQPNKSECSRPDLMDEMKNPFEILVKEFYNMRLDESYDMQLDENSEPKRKHRN